MAEDPAPEPLVAALHAQIQLVASRPIDLRMLTELEKTCLLARELIVIGRQPDAMSRHNMIHSSGSIGAEYGTGNIYPSAMPQFVGSQAMSSGQETFGVQAIRELVNLLPSILPKPPELPPVPEPRMSFSDMATAITVAKDAGDGVLEAQLREALLREFERDKPRESTPALSEAAE